MDRESEVAKVKTQILPCEGKISVLNTSSVVPVESIRSASSAKKNICTSYFHVVVAKPLVSANDRGYDFNQRGSTFEGQYILVPVISVI